MGRKQHIQDRNKDFQQPNRESRGLIAPLVSVVIVTHNSQDFVDSCLESIRRNTLYPRYEVLVVDNNSRDKTKEAVRRYAEVDERVSLISLSENVGFASATNLGVRRSQGAYLILLNIDTIVTSGWIGRLVNQAECDPSIGAVVAVTNSAGNEVRIETSYRTPGEMERFAASLAREKKGQFLEVAVAPLFCVLVRRTVWDAVSGLDDRFRVGMFEDDDLSLKIRERGLRIVCAEDCFIHHFGRGSFSRLADAKYQAVFQQNRRRFEEKWGRPWQPHQYRPGVRGEDYRFSPQDFLAYVPFPISERLAQVHAKWTEAEKQLREREAQLAQEAAQLEEESRRSREKDGQLAAAQQELTRRDEQIQALQKDLQKKANEKEKELARAQHELAQRDEQIQELQKDLLAKVSEWENRYHELQKDLQAKVSEWENRYRELEERASSQISSQREQLDRAERIRRETVMGLETFQSDYQSTLAEYRSQRAWRVMLLFRRAYRLIVREGFSGAVLFFRWLATLPFKAARLEEDELQFPEPSSYISGEIQQPFSKASPQTHSITKQPDKGDKGDSVPLVSILIATFNSSRYVRFCLDSIAQNTIHPAYEIVVVDDASQDDTLQQLSEYGERDSKIRVFSSKANRGFPFAMNFAASLARGDFLVLLNADTIVSEGWLKKLLQHYKEEDVGAVVPVTNWAANEARINVPYANIYQMKEFASLLAVQKRGASRELDVAPLFCALVSRKVWEQVGELDTAYGIGMFEDDDYSNRIRQTGRRILCAEDCFVHHFGGGSFNGLAASDYRRIFEQNQHIYEKKWGVEWTPHKPRFGVPEKRVVFDPATFATEPGPAENETERG